jgi:hypothetical protein
MTKAAELAKMGEVLTTSQIGGRRNIIINGAMQVAQRGTSSTNSNTFATVDRINSRVNGEDNSITQSQVDVASGTTPYSLGFRKAFRYTNADQSSGAGGSVYLFAFHPIEAQNIIASGWDYTSSSSYITVSFWIKSSVSQNFYGYLRTLDGTSQRHAYETGILTADTWTKVEKTFSGNSNITVNNDTGTGLSWYIAPFFGTGYTDSTVSLTSWETYSTSTRTPDGTSTWWTTDGATFEITGLQLEVGEQATPFEHRSFGEELALCQRYFQSHFVPKSVGVFHATNEFLSNVYFPTTMRATPTFTANSFGTGSAYVYSGGSFRGTPNTFNQDGISSRYVLLRYQGGTLSHSGGQAGVLYYADFNLDAEL